MSKKGRRGRSKKPQARSVRPTESTSAVGATVGATAAALDESPPTLPSAAVSGEVSVALAEVAAAEPSAVALLPPPAFVPPPEEPDLTPEPVSAELPEPSVPPVGDLDARFFAESSAEAWLAHELELRDPRFVRKMTASVARRRAHLARYVMGVVGVAVALCLAALVKSAVPVGDGDSRAHPAAQMAMPAERAEPVAQPVVAASATAATAVTAATAEPADGVDGGGG